jgi:hypothetical protein
MAILAGRRRRVQRREPGTGMKCPEGTAAIVEVISDLQLPLRDAVSMPDRCGGAQPPFSTKPGPMRRVIHIPSATDSDVSGGAARDDHLAGTRDKARWAAGWVPYHRSPCQILPQCVAMP